MARENRRAADPPAVSIPKVLDDCQRTQAVHKRSISLLLKCQQEYPEEFMPEFLQHIIPVFNIASRDAPAERMVRFVAAFATTVEEGGEESADRTVEKLLEFLVQFTRSTSKGMRFRCVQLIALTIAGLRDDNEVSDEVWDRVEDELFPRLRDNFHLVRALAARGLQRFVDPGDDGEYKECRTTEAYKQMLSHEKNAEVRKQVLASFPVTAATLAEVIQRSRDINDSVRKVAYMAIGGKVHISVIPLEHRLTLLHHGFKERVPAVKEACIQMLEKSWLERDCGGDVFHLLEYLGVGQEDDMSDVPEKTVAVLLEEGNLTPVAGEGLRSFVEAASQGPVAPSQCNKKHSNGSDSPTSVVDQPEADSDSDEPPLPKPLLLTPAEALYWRVVCEWLSESAQAASAQAAKLGGAQAEVKAAEAEEIHQKLERVLPETVEDYVGLVQGHVDAGPDHSYATEQLLFLGRSLDLADSAGQRAAANFVLSLLQNISETTSYLRAIAALGRHVYNSSNEFVKVAQDVLKELSQRPEGDRDWMKCMAVTVLILQEARDANELEKEVLENLIRLAVEHDDIDIQILGIQSLCLFWHLDPSAAHSHYSFLSKVASSHPDPPVQIIALQGLFDLCLRHNLLTIGTFEDSAPKTWGNSEEIGAKSGENSAKSEENSAKKPENGEGNENMQSVGNQLLKFLEVMTEDGEVCEDQEALNWGAEGWAKLLLFGRAGEWTKMALQKLLVLYFDPATEDCFRLRQCLTVFFKYFTLAKPEHKAITESIFLQTFRSAWQGHCFAEKPAATTAHRLATTLAKFMLEMLQLGPINKTTEKVANEEDDENGQKPPKSSKCEKASQALLALDLAAEVLKPPNKKQQDGFKEREIRPYETGLSRLLKELHYTAEEPEAVHVLRRIIVRLLGRFNTTKGADKQAAKDLQMLDNRLMQITIDTEKALDEGRLEELAEKARVAEEDQVLETPAAAKRASRQAKSTGRLSRRLSLSSPEMIAMAASARPSRQSKTAAMEKTRKQVAAERMKPLFEEGDASSAESLPQEASDESEQLAHHEPKRHSTGNSPISGRPGQAASSALLQEGSDMDTDTVDQVCEDDEDADSANETSVRETHQVRQSPTVQQPQEENHEEENHGEETHGEENHEEENHGEETHGEENHEEENYEEENHEEKHHGEEESQEGEESSEEDDSESESS